MTWSSTLWFDDVAARAVMGDTPIIIAVCQEPHSAGLLCDWLETAIPALGELQVQRVAASEMCERVERAGTEGTAVALVVPDATLASDAELPRRWQQWNLLRDALRDGLLADPTCDGQPLIRRALVLICTERPFRQVAALARDLVSVAEVMRVDAEPPALDPSDHALVTEHQQVLREMEGRYGVSTAELMGRLYEQQPLPTMLTPSDLHRWQAAAQLLRRV